jgi:hypothetical protein
VTDKPRPRRVALIDLPWLGHNSVLVATPLAVRPIGEIRVALKEFMRRNPTTPLACRLDTRASRWLPVPAAEREAHLDRILIAAGDPDPDDLAGHVVAHQAAVAPDLPLVVVVTPGSIMTQICHAVGDAVTATRLMRALVRAEPDELAGLAQRVGTAGPVRALIRGLRPHHRDWAHYLRSRSGPPVAEPVGPAAPAQPSFTGTTISNAGLRDITRWRNANARGVSLTCVLTCAMHRALCLHGVPMHGSGYYALIDMRTMLPDNGKPHWGNLCKSLYLAADLTDPYSVESALRKVRDTDRALPASVIGAVTTAMTRPRPPAATQAPVAPVTLTFNSIPTLPGLSDLPWHDEVDRRFYGFGRSRGPGSISVSVLRLRGHMELTASFDEATVTAETMRSALEAVGNPETLLSGLTVRT